MQEMVTRVLSDLLGALRFKWHGLAFAWVICVAGWIGVALMPNTYESRARLYIDTATVLRPLLVDLAVNTNVMSEVRMMTEVLRSRPQLERVIRESDLDLRANTPEQMEDLLEDVRRRIQVTGGVPQNPYTEQTMYTISFTDRDPQTVHAVVQSLLDSFVDQSLGQNKADSVGAQKFIEAQVAEYEQRLAEAEQRLAEFKKENVGLMPSAGQDYYERLQAALEELEDARSEYSRVARRRDELQKQIDGEEPTFGLLGSPEDTGGGGETSNASIEASEQELARLLLKYTEKHPEVIAVRERIAQLRRQQRERLAAAGSDADRPSYELNTELMSMNSLDLNPVYQSLKISISQANAELSELEEEVTDAEKKVSYLRRMVDTIPEVEAQLARLNRDYDVNKAQHTALLRRLESARLSEEVDSQSEDMKFQIIEPPLVPLEPTGPNRLLFSTAVLIAGVGIGGALSWFLNLINPAFNTIEELRRKLQLPVLGSVSVFRSQADQKENRRKWRRFGFASALLLVAYSAAIFLRPATEFVRTALLDGGML